MFSGSKRVCPTNATRLNLRTPSEVAKLRCGEVPCDSENTWTSGESQDNNRLPASHTVGSLDHASENDVGPWRRKDKGDLPCQRRDEKAIVV